MADPEWDEWAQHVRDELIPMLEQSSVYVAISPDGKPDVKFCVELGLAVYLNKPLVIVCSEDREVPPGLRRVAHHVIDGVDFKTAAGRDDLFRRLEPILGSRSDG